MIEIKTAKKENIKEMNELWNEVVLKDKFFKPISQDDYEKYLYNIPKFNLDGVKLAYKDNILVGFGIVVCEGDLTKNENAAAFINSIIVKCEYRHQGIGAKLLTSLEEYLKEVGYNNISVYGHLPSCYAWYIPNTDHHDHPCAPGVSVNSDLYFFLIHHGYEATGFQDAFHLNLSDYEISPTIKEILDRNKKDNITIELYDPNKHYGIDEFCKELNIYDFEYVIKDNLKLEHPYPFLVVSENGKVKGWTGAMWNEESGRGHFDGIAILPSVRGRGLGKALFSLLAYNSKLNGAKFMTFYTNLNNHARYIYMGAGFKIIQTFALMKKKIK